MRNLVQDGETVTLTAPSALTAGDIVNVGALVGIAVTDAANGAAVPVKLTGVYSGLPLKTGDTFTAGTLAYYDAENDELTTDADDGGNPATAFPKFGVALGGGKFRLNGAF